MYSLTRYRGRGTRRDPFIPIGSEQPGWQAIDLRADGGRTRDGAGQPYALIWTPEPIPGAVSLGMDLTERAARATLRAVATHLHVAPWHPGLGGVLATALLVPPTDGWNRFRLTRRQMLGLIAGSFAALTLAPTPALAVSASDNFNRANETPLAGNWHCATGATADLISNAVTGNSSDSTWRYTGATFGDDQDVSLTWASGPLGDGGPAARVSASTLQGYFLTYGSNPPICKYVAASFTALGGTAATPSVGNIYRLTVQGSTLSAYLAGVPKGSTTDSSLTTSDGGPGLFLYNSGDTWDDWSATDVVGGGGGGSRHGQLLGVGP